MRIPEVDAGEDHSDGAIGRPDAHQREERGAIEATERGRIERQVRVAAQHERRVDADRPCHRGDRRDRRACDAEGGERSDPVDEKRRERGVRNDEARRDHHRGLRIPACTHDGAAAQIEERERHSERDDPQVRRPGLGNSLVGAEDRVEKPCPRPTQNHDGDAEEKAEPERLGDDVPGPRPIPGPDRAADERAKPRVHEIRERERDPECEHRGHDGRGRPRPQAADPEEVDDGESRVEGLARDDGPGKEKQGAADRSPEDVLVVAHGDWP